MLWVVGAAYPVELEAQIRCVTHYEGGAEKLPASTGYRASPYAVGSATDPLQEVRNLGSAKN